jgi:hypothetical protein
MRYIFPILILTLSYTFASGTSEASEPIPKTESWKVLADEWKKIEPTLFSEGNNKLLGKTVRFDSKLINKKPHLQVRTALGTNAVVKQVPKTDLELLDEFKRSPKHLFIEGTITKIDTKTRTIEILADGIRPSN